MQEMSSLKLPTLILRDEIFIKHEPGLWHPESPERLKTIYTALDNRLSGQEGYKTLPPRAATRQELAWNHDPEYIERISRTAGVDHFQLDPDTSTSAHSWEAAIKAAGGLFLLVDQVVDQRAANGFGLVRPPGHHAERDRAMGFCLFNNVALAAHYAMNVHGLERVLIIDWDLHHGNGTQHSFYQDRRVLYFSTHQFPYYPGTGRLEEAGAGGAEGFTVNVPMSAGKGDPEYGTVFSRILRPVCLEFSPQLILVSAGFDIYRDDPLGGMRVSAQGFGLLAAQVLDMAYECCGGRVIFTLEGGYNLVGLRDGVLEVLSCCRKNRTEISNIIESLETADIDFKELAEALSFHSRYWPVQPIK